LLSYHSDGNGTYADYEGLSFCAVNAFGAPWQNKSVLSEQVRFDFQAARKKCPEHPSGSPRKTPRKGATHLSFGLCNEGSEHFVYPVSKGSLVEVFDTLILVPRQWPPLRTGLLADRGSLCFALLGEPFIQASQINAEQLVRRLHFSGERSECGTLGFRRRPPNLEPGANL